MGSCRRSIAVVAVVLVLLAGCGPAVTTVRPPSTTIPPTPVPATAVPPTAASPLAPTTTPSPTAAVELLREWINLGAGQGPVYDQSWSSDGRLFAAADYDQIRVWEIDARRETGLLRGHTDFVTGLAWSPNANVLASASQDGTVRLWDGTTFTSTAVLTIGQALGCLTWSPDGRQVAVGTYTGDVHLWDVTTQEVLKTWSTHAADSARDDIISIAWSPDGQTVASGDLEGNICLWDVATGQARLVLTEQTPGERARDVNGLSWSPDGSMLASAHPDGQVQLWDSATGRMLRAIAAHTPPASDVAWSPTGEFLASIGHVDRCIRLWDPETGHLYAEASHASLPGWSISWSPDGSKVASGCGKWQQPHVGEIIVWTVPSPSSTPSQAPTPPGTAATSEQTSSAVDGRVIVPENLQALKRLHTFSGYAIAFHPAEPIIAAGELTGKVKLWDLPDGILLRDLVDLYGMVFDLDFSPDGSLLAAAFDANAVVIDAETGDTLAAIDGLGQFIQAVAFSPDGGLLAVGGSNGIKILRATDWQEIAELHGHQGGIFDLVFTPAGDALVSSGGIPDSAVIVWDVEHFEIRDTLEGHSGDVHSLAVSPDGLAVASGGTDRTVILWDISTGARLREFSGYQDVIYGLAYSPAGDLLAAGCGSDGYVMFWDTANKRALFKLYDEGAMIRQVKFSPDGYYLAESNTNHQIVIWSIQQGR